MDTNINIHILEVRNRVTEHFHNFLEIAYIKEGSVMHTVNGVTQILQKGDYVFVDYNSCHSYCDMSSDLIIINCLFKPGLIDKSISSCRNLRDLLYSYMINIGYVIGPNLRLDSPFHDKDQRILGLLLKIKEEYLSSSTGYLQIIRSALVEIVIDTFRKREITDCLALANSNAEIGDLLDCINSNLSESITLSQIAANRHISVSLLSRRFKESTGLSFIDYLQQKRIEQACSLLCNTTRAVPEIAEGCGYKDIKFFNELFKRIVGITPSRYRRQQNESRSL